MIQMRVVHTDNIIKVIIRWFLSDFDVVGLFCNCMYVCRYVSMFILGYPYYKSGH